MAEAWEDVLSLHLPGTCILPPGLLDIHTLDIMIAHGLCWDGGLFSNLGKDRTVSLCVLTLRPYSSFSKLLKFTFSSLSGCDPGSPPRIGCATKLSVCAYAFQ